ncbi:hypothetical protein [Acaryochloris sp. CCMEE 5410]|uniref:hypothetical protein n=1 Tax=Acaryochloris sp. CCMEE 5410 TaxID=310037 RepID=UPI0021D28E73|nr:hypothetical protein [Acaryochloris sp. CCMEE 5410]
MPIKPTPALQETLVPKYPVWPRNKLCSTHIASRRSDPIITSDRDQGGFLWHNVYFPESQAQDGLQRS